MKEFNVSLIVRVATSNNFNCTIPEWKQIKQFERAHPDKQFFVNSNINTPKIRSISKHINKTVVTLNPDINIPTKALNTLEAIKDNIAFVRIKYIPERPDIEQLIQDVMTMDIPIVMTLQRFNSKKTLEKYSSLVHYKHSHSRYRLHGSALEHITSLVHNAQETYYPIYICDEKGTGCGGCGLCSTLTTGQSIQIKALNLSSSGICPYNCPDCYAKTMQNFCIKMGHNPIQYDTIKQNDKQAGKTKHIKEALLKAA